MEIQINNLMKTYGEIMALDHISLQFHNGIYGLLGPNGAGKSTLMGILSLLLKRSGGDVLLDGQDIVKLDIQYLSRIGYMPQENCLYDDFTLQEGMYYVGALKGMQKDETLQQTASIIKEVGLQENRNQKMKTFSGGMKKRAMFAQTLLNHPDILILDEPTAGLDPQKRIELRNTIARLSKDKIVIIATHVVSDIEYIANTIVLMKKGVILKTGSTQELLASIEGCVVEIETDEQALENLQKEYEISNLHYEEGKLLARMIVKDASKKTGTLQRPNLDDVYLYYFGNTP